VLHSVALCRQVLIICLIKKESYIISRKQKLGRITWVCATCSEHFTRGYGANRHNNNLHEGKGTVVRLLDYIVGRINGQFLPKDPLEYRRKKGKDNKNLLFVSNHNNSNNNNLGSKVISDSMNDILSHENIVSKPPKPRSKANSTYHYSDDKYDSDNADERPCHSNRVSQPSSKVDDNDNNKLFSYTHKLVERRLKLEEFKILVNKYYPPQNASQFLAAITYMVIQENDDDFLDKQLTFLRNIGKGELCHENAFDKAVGNNRDDVTKLYPHLFHYSLLQPMKDKKVYKSSEDEHMQAKAKLAEIGQILSPFCLPQFVQNVITGLTNKYNATGDISILDTALENHRRNGERYHTRY
jgi:hypothetical protein